MVEISTSVEDLTTVGMSAKLKASINTTMKPTEYDYIVFFDNEGFYEAIEGLSGNLAFGGKHNYPRNTPVDGTNKDAVTQAAIDALAPNGGFILLKDLELGTVVYGSNILICSNYRGTRQFFRDNAILSDVGDIYTPPVGLTTKNTDYTVYFDGVNYKGIKGLDSSVPFTNATLNGMLTSITGVLSEGNILLKNIQFDYSFVIPQHVSVVESYRGGTRKFINLNDSAMLGEYTVETDSSNTRFFVVDASKSYCAFSTVCKTMVNSLLSFLQAIGGKITYGVGIFPVNMNLDNPNFEISGNEEGGTILYASGDNLPIISINGGASPDMNISVHDLTLDGTGYSGINGIDIAHNSRSFYYNLMVQNCDTRGIYFESSQRDYLHDIFIKNCGICMEAIQVGGETVFENIHATFAATNCFIFDSVNYVKADGIYAISANGDGIVITSHVGGYVTSYNTWSNLWALTNGATGSGVGIRISGNIISNTFINPIGYDDQSVPTQRDGMDIVTTGKVTIIGGHFNRNTNDGIYIDSISTNVTLIDTETNLNTVFGIQDLSGVARMVSCRDNGVYITNNFQISDRLIFGDSSLGAILKVVSDSIFDVRNKVDTGYGGIHLATAILEPSSAPSSPTAGQVYSNGSAMFMWNGSVWKQVAFV